jgi:hypothetical protein
MWKKNIKMFIISFIAIFVLFIIINKYTGYINRFSTAYIEPVSWHEIISLIPRILIFSIIGAFFWTFFFSNAEKQKQKDRKKMYEQKNNKVWDITKEILDKREEDEKQSRK